MGSSELTQRYEPTKLWPRLWSSVECKTEGDDREDSGVRKLMDLWPSMVGKERTAGDDSMSGEARRNLEKGGDQIVNAMQKEDENARGRSACGVGWVLCVGPKAYHSSFDDDQLM